MQYKHCTLSRYICRKHIVVGSRCELLYPISITSLECIVRFNAVYPNLPSRSDGEGNTFLNHLANRVLGNGRY